MLCQHTQQRLAELASDVVGRLANEQALALLENRKVGPVHPREVEDPVDHIGGE